MPENTFSHVLQGMTACNTFYKRSNRHHFVFAPICIIQSERLEKDMQFQGKMSHNFHLLWANGITQNLGEHVVNPNPTKPNNKNVVQLLRLRHRNSTAG